MTPAAALLAEEIARSGPLPFTRFMEVALYHPEHGYYRRRRDPFGKHGDFYTAAQVQPVFGILMAGSIRRLRRELGDPTDFQVIDLGAGRAEMAAAFSELGYQPVEAGDELPQVSCGVIFANEFFDALPVHCLVCRGGEFRERLVDWQAGRFTWVEGGPASAELADYAGRYLPYAEGSRAEVNLEALRWIERIAARLGRGFLLAIDYGYTSAEAGRFPEGTLLSYRRHQALDDVLADPGERDITAHVHFTALQQHAAAHGFETVVLEPLARTLLAAGEADQFAAALDAPSPVEAQRRRLQLKTLLFGMGETFRTLLLQRAR